MLNVKSVFQKSTRSVTKSIGDDWRMQNRRPSNAALL
jgi:hypothetical protein